MKQSEHFRRAALRIDNPKTWYTFTPYKELGYVDSELVADVRLSRRMPSGRLCALNALLVENDNVSIESLLRNPYLTAAAGLFDKSSIISINDYDGHLAALMVLEIAASLAEEDGQ